MQGLHFFYQIKVSTKSSSKDLAAFINKQLKGKDQVRKDFENHKDEL